MSVDVTTEVVIERSVDVVADYAAAPEHVPDWYVHIRSATYETDPPLRVGSRLAFVARFLGRQIEYTYEVVDYVPRERLVMRTASGPFPMETTYTWGSTGPERTRMTLRNRGEPAGFSKATAPLMRRAVRRANVRDLARLKTILETG